MGRYTYDLHVHSCLSPCGDDDSTPNNICGMATLCGLNIVALTDHNTAKNCPAFMEAAKRYGLIGVPGMEVTTAEDIHAVCLFETLEECVEFDGFVDSRRIRIPNRKDIFGRQLILNGEDEVIGEEEFLLPNATLLSLDELFDAVRSAHGVCYPAHIDRPGNGMIAILGTFPETPAFRAFEVHDREKLEEYRTAYHLEDKLAVVSSDAHYLTDLRDDNASFELEDEPYSSALIRKKLIEKIRNA